MSAVTSKNTVFRIECVEEDVGRIRKHSKKWLTWRFKVVESAGVSHHPMDAGPPMVDLLAGPIVDVRPPPITAPAPAKMVSKTYSISLTWSFKSGKQSLEVNGTELWFGRKRGGAIFSHAWQEGDLQLEVLGTCQPPKRHVSPDFRSFDLMINGKNFEDLPILGKDEAAHSSTTISVADLPKSIVEILYPNGYRWTPSPGGQG